MKVKELIKILESGDQEVDIEIPFHVYEDYNSHMNYYGIDEVIQMYDKKAVLKLKRQDYIYNNG